MSSGQYNKEELADQARQGETVVPGGTDGKSITQQRLAKGDYFYLYRCINGSHLDILIIVILLVYGMCMTVT